MLNTWDDKFIPFGITNNTINFNFDHYERLGYIANICQDNYENNFHLAIVDIRIKRDHIYSGYVYNDIDNGRQKPTLQLLSAIGNIKAIDLSSDSISPFVISYRNKKWPILLNDWKDPHYFTLAFLCLFSNKTKGHLE